MYKRQRNIDYIELSFDVSHGQMWGCPAGLGASSPQNQLRLRLTSNVFSDGNSALHSDLSFSQDVAANGNELVPLGNNDNDKWKEVKAGVHHIDLCISPQYLKDQFDLSMT